MIKNPFFIMSTSMSTKISNIKDFPIKKVCELIIQDLEELNNPFIENQKKSGILKTGFHTHSYSTKSGNFKDGYEGWDLEDEYPSTLLIMNVNDQLHVHCSVNTCGCSETAEKILKAVTLRIKDQTNICGEYLIIEQPTVFIGQQWNVDNEFSVHDCRVSNSKIKRVKV